MTVQEAIDYLISVAPGVRDAILVLEAAGLVSPRDHKFLTLLAQDLEDKAGVPNTPISNPTPNDGTPKS